MIGICVVVDVLVVGIVLMLIFVMIVEDVYILFDLNVVKLVCNVCNEVMYFSCVLIVWYCDGFVCSCDMLLDGYYWLCYIGIYGYCVGFL